MLAVYATQINPEDPLNGLAVGDMPDPSPPDGWKTITVKAAALNHHDLWSLRGVGLAADALPMILGCDAAGIDEDGNEVVVHAVITSDSWRDDETLDPRRSLLSERYQGTLAEKVAVPTRNLVPKPPELSFEHAACLPTAWLTAYRMLFTRGGVTPGMTVLVQGAGGGVATALTVLGSAAGRAGVGDEPLRGQARGGARPRRRPGLRVRRPAARARRRGHGDRGQGHLGPLGPIAEARRQDRRVGRDVGRRITGRADPGVLPPAVRWSAPPWAPGTSSSG